MSAFFIALAVVVLALLAVVAAKGGAGRRISPLTSLAFAFVLAGIVLGSEPRIGYPLIGVGLILALGEIVHRLRMRAS